MMREEKFPFLTACVSAIANAVQGIETNDKDFA